MAQKAALGLGSNAYQITVSLSAKEGHKAGTKSAKMYFVTICPVVMCSFLVLTGKIIK
jgi:hypothetical protein